MTHSHTQADLPRCRAMLGQLNDYLDGDLAAELCQALETHMAGCHDCQLVFDTLGQTVRLYHSLDDAPAELPADIEARLLLRLQEKASSAARSEH